MTGDKLIELAVERLRTTAQDNWQMDLNGVVADLLEVVGNRAVEMRSSLPDRHIDNETIASNIVGYAEAVKVAAEVMLR